MAEEGVPVIVRRKGRAPMRRCSRRTSAARPLSGCDMGAFEFVPEADLAVGQHASPDPAPPGAELAYSVYLTDTGPQPATGVVLTDPLPSGATFGSATPSQGSCLSTSLFVCNLGGLASSAHASVTVAVTPTAAGLMTNVATAASDEFDPALANNTAVATAAVVRELYLPLVTRGP